MSLAYRQSIARIKADTKRIREVREAMELDKHSTDTSKDVRNGFICAAWSGKRGRF